MHSVIWQMSGYHPRSIAKKEIHSPIERNVPKLTLVVVRKRQRISTWNLDGTIRQLTDSRRARCFLFIRQTFRSLNAICLHSNQQERR